MLIFVMVTAAAPSLVKVTLRLPLEPTTMLPKLRDAGVNPNAKVWPVPVRLMICIGLPGQLSFSVTPPLRVPVVVGVKVTVMEQFCPAANAVGQVLFSEKSPELAMELKFTE